MLRRSFGLAFLFVVAAGALWPARPTAQREAREHHVYVGVTTSRGAPVPGLGPADFVVREDNQTREVVRVTPAPPPSHLAILVDNSAAAESMIPEIRDALSRFVQAFADIDRAPALSVVTFGERPTVASPFTTSLPITARAVVGIFARPQSGAYLLESIFEIAGTLKKATPAPVQPAIVAFTIDGSTEFSDLRAERVADALKESGASLWTVSVGTGNDAHRERGRVVGDVTRDSGGMNRPTLSRAGLENTMAATAAAILTRYDVVYGRGESLVPPARLTVEGRDRAWRLTAPRWPGR